MEQKAIGDNTPIIEIALNLHNVSAMRSAGLRGTHYQTTQAYERGRTLEFSNKPALRMSGC